MSFLDSLLYSFSNIFSIGPDLYDDGDECCGGVGPGGTCCKNYSPKLESSSPPILSCQQKQDLYACHCPSDDSHNDASWRTIKLVVCGHPPERQKAPSTLPALTLLEKHLPDPSDAIKTCTVALDTQCQDLLLTLSSCVFILSDTKKDNMALNKLLGWMNEQITTSHHQPLQRLVYGIVCTSHDQYGLASLFQQKLDQLGATAAIGIWQHQDELDHWAKDFITNLKQGRPSTTTPNETSAGCTHGMVDVEELGQVARKIQQTKEQQVTWSNLRGRSKRTIELDNNPTPQSSIKAAPTTGSATLVPTYGSMSSSLDF